MFSSSDKTFINSFILEWLLSFAALRYDTLVKYGVYVS